MDEHIQKRGNPYPFSTYLAPDDIGSAPGGYSIFLLGLRHRVYLQDSNIFGFGYQKRLIERERAWSRVATDLNWALHPHLLRSSEMQYGARTFEPARVLCKSAQESLLGCSFPNVKSKISGNPLIRARLDAKDPACPREEPLLLTLANEDAPLFRRPLQVCTGRGEQREFYGFSVEWVDLWLFPDGHVFKPLCNAVLACKVTPSEVEDEKGNVRAYRVGDLAVLNRLLRDLDLGGNGGAWLAKTDETGVGEHFWEGVLRHWLGIQIKRDGDNILVCDRGEQTDSMNLLRLLPQDSIWSDRHSDYVKVLTVARISEPSPDSGWDCPQVDLGFDPTRVFAEKSHRSWSPEQASWLQSKAFGYPSLGDALLYELASTANEGSSLGMNGTVGFQVSKDYLREVFAQSGIEIWERWKGLALRDTCAFLASHPAMPIMQQAEERYYALYLHFYYCQLRLHNLSEDIIEYELLDVKRAREVQRAFIQFRNQFWFQETAVGFQGLAIANAVRVGMRLDALYNSVATEIRDVSQYIDDQASAGRQRLIAILLVMIYPVAFFWDVYKEPILRFARDVDPVWLLGLAAALFFMIVALARRFGTQVSRWAERLADRLRREGW